MKHFDKAFRLLAATLAMATVAGCPSQNGGSEVEQELTDPSGGSGASTGSPPTIWGDPAASALVGSQYIFMPGSDDPDGDVLTFEIANQPGWTDFDEATGALQGIPADTDSGINGDIVISVSDSNSVVSLPSFSITVEATGGSSEDEDDGIASGGDGGTSGGDGGDGGTSGGDGGTSGGDGGASGGDDGGTSGGDDGGASGGDDDSGASDDDESPSSPPTIGGHPNTSAIVDTEYTFQPDASDPDGDTLSFSIVNKPLWASFDTTTGRLSGKPDSGDVGMTDNIELSVTDGEHVNSLTPFSIAVEPVATASATLSWTSPTRNDDGSPLTDLAGYRIYYGTVSGEYNHTIEVNSSGVSSYVIDGLAAGTYFLAMTTVNSIGTESAYSAELRFEIGT